MQKPIQFSYHAQEQLAYRGTTEDEVIETIRSSIWEAAERGRLCCRKNFPFYGVWNSKIYQTKQIRPIFAEEENAIVIVTVYVYYF